MFGGKFDATVADHDAIKLEEYYRSYGYVDCHVSREVELSPDGNYATLVFHIREGQHLFRRLNFPQHPRALGVGRRSRGEQGEGDESESPSHMRHHFPSRVSDT